FDAPDAIKQGAVPPDARVRGYTPMLRQQLAASLGKDTPPDLFERFRMGAFDLPDDDYHASRAQGWFAPNVWPAGMPGLRPALEAYYRAMEDLAADLMRLFALALDLPADYFRRSIDRHISSLCLNHYPALATAPAPGQLRAGEHTDYGSLTIVAPSDAPGRLQVLSRDRGWVEVDPPPGHFVVNIGDLMAQWTNDRWVSTLHRVGLPADDAGARARRLSLVFFHQPNDDARIDCIPTCLGPGDTPRYAPVTSGEHLRLKINRHFTTPTAS
ncbi:MAG: isopenicillin N synthase family oxygenase, partial [Comamonadaceae bacterium]